MTDPEQGRAILAEALHDPGLRETLSQIATLAGCGLVFRDAQGLVVFESTAGAGGAECGGAPLVFHGAGLGSFGALSADGRTLSPEAGRTATALAARLLGERMRIEEEKNSLSREILEKYQELNTLYQVSESLASAQDPHSVAAEILRQAVEGVSPRWAALRLYESEAFVARTVAAHGFRPRGTNRREPVDESSFLWECVSGGRPVLVTRVGEVPDGRRRVALDFPGVDVPEDCSLLVVPLRSTERVQGALLLLGRTDHRPFRAEDVKFLTTVASQAAISLGHLRLAENSQELFLSTVWALSDAIDMKDRYTRGHSQRVARFSLGLAQALGYDSRELRELEVSALLHDVGKIGISEAILQKPGPLTEEEMRRIQAHPVLGEQIVQNVRLLEGLTGNIRLHHENWDGSGYPDGVRGERIPPVARIIHITDTFDAMTSHRVYRTKRPMDYVFREYERCRGTMFDPEMTDAFVELVRDGVVRAHSDTLDTPIPESARVAPAASVPGAASPDAPADAAGTETTR